MTVGDLGLAHGARLDVGDLARDRAAVELKTAPEAVDQHGGDDSDPCGPPPSFGLAAFPSMPGLRPPGKATLR